MKNNIARIIIVSLMSVALLAPMYAQADWGDRKRDSRQDNRSDRYKDKRSDRTKYKRSERRSDKRQIKHKRNKLVVITPRHRTFRNVRVIRRHGHAYHGYGHILHDNDAWKWLAFTAITLKILDNVNEQAQREHEAAQVKATVASVGEKITWQTESASGYVVTTKQGTNSNGATCREFQQEVTIGGETEDAYGTACLQGDGSWKINS